MAPQDAWWKALLRKLGGESKPARKQTTTLGVEILEQREVFDATPNSAPSLLSFGVNDIITDDGYKPYTTGSDNEFKFTVTASDVDLGVNPSESLTFALLWDAENPSNDPSSAYITPLTATTAEVTWTYDSPMTYPNPVTKAVNIQVTDHQGLTAVRKAYLQVNGWTTYVSGGVTYGTGHSPPVAVDDVVNLGHNWVVTFSVADLLENDDPGSNFTIVADPTYGILSDNLDGTYTYERLVEYEGYDSFTYKTDNIGVPGSTVYESNIGVVSLVDVTFVTCGDCPNDCDCPTASESDGTSETQGGFPRALVYSVGDITNTSNRSLPHVAMSFDLELDTSAGVPDMIRAEMNFGGVVQDAVYFSTDGFSDGDPYRITLLIDADNLPSGVHNWVLKLTTMAGGMDLATEIQFGARAIQNSHDSIFGPGWQMASLSRLNTSRADGVALVNGNGENNWFARQANGTYTRNVGDDSQSQLRHLFDTDEFEHTDKFGTVSVYNAAGMLISVIDRNGNATTYTYIDADSDSEVDELETVTDYAGRTVEFVYDMNGRVESIVDDAGRTTFLEYNLDGLLISITAPDPDGMGPLEAAVTEFGYDADGLLISKIDPVGRETTYTYDNGRGLSGGELPCGCPFVFQSEHTATLAYVGVSGTYSDPAPLFDPEEIFGYEIDANDNIRYFKTDKFGNITIEIDGLGNRWEYEYDEEGQLVSMLAPDPDGAGPLGAQTTTYSYDSTGNLLSIVHPGEITETWTYESSFKQVTSYTDGRGNVTLYEIDSGNGNVLSITQVVGSLDSLVNLETDDVVTEFTYTLYVTSGDPPSGLVATMTDPLGRITEYEYDEFGQVVAVTLASGTADEVTYEYEYTAAGMLEKMTDPLGRETVYAYDNLDRLILVTLPDPDTGDMNAAPTISYTYDELDRIASVTDQLGRVTTYEYENFGRQVIITRPDHDGDSEPTVTVYNYDSVKLLKNVVDPLGQTVEYHYDSLNRPIETVLPDPDGAGPLTASTYFTLYDNWGRVVKSIDPATQPILNATPTVTNSSKTFNYSFGTASSIINLSALFADVNQASTSLRFEVAGKNSNSGIISAVAFSPTEPWKLLVTFEPDAVGKVQLTVLATDDGGLAASCDISIQLNADSYQTYYVTAWEYYGYTQLSGSWSTEYPDGSPPVQQSSSSNAKAEFEFTGLTAGWQEVSARIPASEYYTANAIFSIYSGVTLIATVRVNERTQRTGEEYFSLGRYEISGSDLTVEVENDGDGYLVVDSIRVTNSSAPAIGQAVLDNNSPLLAFTGTWTETEEGLGDSTYRASDTSSQAFYTLTNLAAGWHELSAYIPDASGKTDLAWYEIYQGNTLVATIAIDQSAVEDEWISLGKFETTGENITVSLINQGSGDVVADALRVTSTIAREQAGTAMMDADSPYYTEGGSGWSTGTGAGVGGSYQSHASGSGSNYAEWSFAGMRAATYELRVAWEEDVDRATDATYEVYVGNTLVQTFVVDQTSAPVSSGWEMLGTFSGSGDIRIRLTDDANGVVIADAVELIATTGAPGAEVSTDLQVISVSPAEEIYGSLQQLVVTFSDPVFFPLMSAAQFELTGPSGSVTITGISQVSQTQIAVHFASQTEVGEYTLTVLPTVRGADGNLLDQDLDDDPGEAGDDEAVFIVEILEALPIPQYGATTQYVYDARGRIVDVIDAKNKHTTYTYDENNNITSVTDPLYRTTTYTYDDLNRLIRIDEPSATTEFEYDKASNLRFVIDPRGATTEYQYDNLNRLIKLIYADPDAGGPLDSPEEEFAYDAASQLVSYTDPLGRVTSYTYDGLGRLSTVTGEDPDGVGGDAAPVITYVYDDANRLTSYTDALGRETLYAYDVLDNLIEVTLPDPDGVGGVAAPVWTFTYDANGQKLTETDPLLRTTTFAYDTLGRLISQALPDPDGVGGEEAPVWEYAYDMASNLIGVTDPLGRTTSYEYDKLYQVTAIEDELNGRLRYTYDDAGQLTQFRDQLNRLTEYAYDDMGRVEYVTPPSFEGQYGTETSQPWQYDYDDNGNVTSITDPLYRTTTYEYDLLNRLTAIEDELDGRIEYDYDNASQIVAMRDQLDRETTYEYDGLGRLIAVTLPDPDAGGGLAAPVWQYGYDLAGNRTSVTDPRSNTTTYAFDGLDRLTTVTQPNADGNGSPVTTYSYDAASQLLTVNDPLNRTTTYAFDSLGRLTSETDENSEVTAYTYDALGNVLTITNALLQVTEFEYDALYRRTKQIDALDGETTFTYDAVGNLLSLTDPEDNTTTWQYDNQNNVKREINELNESRYFGYDALGNLLQKTDRNNRLTQYQYDELYRLTDETWYDEYYSQVYTAEFSYDAAGQLLNASDNFSEYSYTYDDLGRVTEIDNDGTPSAPHVILTQTFDAANNRLSVAAEIDSTADYLNEYTYDALNRMTQVTQTDQLGGNAVDDKRVDFAYNKLGQFAEITRYTDLAGTTEVATTTFGYDALARLEELTHEKVSATTTLAAYTWTYDEFSRIVSQTSPDGTVDYDYDDTNQLTGADHSALPDETYSYDANGNRTMGGYTTGANNQLLSDGTYNYQYDDEGNRTRREHISSGEFEIYTWDHHNRLTKVEKYDAYYTLLSSVDYTYDVFDRRIARTADADGAGMAPAVTEHYVYDGDHIALVFDGTGDLTNRYLHGPAIDQILADEQLVSGLFDQTLWMLTDHLGTIRDIADDLGVVQNHIQYDSFGMPLSETNGSVSHRFGFTGREFDELTGLQYNRARYYDPVVGKWVSEDPIGFLAGDTNIARAAGNSPLTFRDPFGLDNLYDTLKYEVQADGTVHVYYIDAGMWMNGTPEFVGTWDPTTDLLDRYGTKASRSTVEGILGQWSQEPQNHKEWSEWFKANQAPFTTGDTTNAKLICELIDPKFIANFQDTYSEAGKLAEEVVLFYATAPLSLAEARALANLARGRQVVAQSKTATETVTHWKDFAGKAKQIQQQSAQNLGLPVNSTVKAMAAQGSNVAMRSPRFGLYARRVDNFKHALEPSHVQTALREKNGAITGINPMTRLPWDHLTETRNNMAGAKDHIRALNRFLTDPNLPCAMRTAVESELGEISILLDNAERILGELAR